MGIYKYELKLENLLQDLADLFGFDQPAPSTSGAQSFAWVDGPLLTAIKNNHWILIDEVFFIL